MAPSVKIEYRFHFEDGKVKCFLVDLDSKSLNCRIDSSEPPPAWAQLDHKKCGNCPLKSSETPLCPAARNLAAVLNFFKEEKSFERVRVEVITERRTIINSLSLQEGLHGLFGLLMATSGCPHMDFLKPMARFHLPFASLEETLMRSLGTYLVLQYLIQTNKGKPDFGLVEFNKKYLEIQTVNQGFINRMRSVAKGDANANSLVILDGYAQLLAMELSSGFTDLKRLFPELEPTKATSQS